MKRFKSVVWGTLLAASFSLATAWAQDAPPPAPDDKPSPAIQHEGPVPPPDSQPAEEDSNQPEPPSRVARLQFMSGSVSIQPQGTGDWVAGVINRPLTTSDNIWTDKDSRTELNVGSGLIRLNSESSLTLTGVSDNSTQLELHQGTLNLHVRNLAQGETYEIDTPNTAFTVQTAGEYRVNVDSEGNSSLITVRRGEGQATSNGANVSIHTGEQARFGDGTSGNGDIAEAPAPDSFDTWCNGRDQRSEHSVSAQYVSPDVIGSQDLDEYGSWQNTQDYGNVWYPSGVDADWAPYHYGHWDSISPWGWTWVDDEPWGFAPFHYGRWIYGGRGWGWAPGPYGGRPFYAPALVSWYGGAGWGVGFGFGFGGGIGWCPLGFGEPFFPWYHTGFGYFNRVNIYNTRFANFNRFRGGFGRPGFGANFRSVNLRNPGGRFAVPSRALSNSMSVRNMGVRMSESQFSRASLGGRVPVNATRVSRLGATAGRATAISPSRSFARQTVSRASFGNNASGFNRGASSSARSVARPNNGGFANRGVSSPGATNRSFAGSSNAAANRNVPRPPAGMSRPNGGFANGAAQSRSFSSPQNRSNSGSFNRGSNPQGFNRGGSNYVPRPSGPVRSSDYAANNGYRGSSSTNYSSRGYESRSYGNAGSYSSPNRSSNYNSGSSTRSYQGPAGRSYSAAPSYRSYSAPSQGYSGRSYSAPQSRSNSGYSGGGGHSYSGGGGGHSYSGGGGGGRSYGGGGSGHSSGGGGGHGGGGRR